MAENVPTLINAELPDCVDNALTNLSDKPTLAVGNTLADIWFLVFGGISHSAEKRRLRYSYELNKYSNELKEKLERIPESKRIEPDIQIVAPALEASKYCVEKEGLRSLFVNLITSSMNKDKIDDVHPIYTDIISKLSANDAAVFKALSQLENHEALVECDECIIWRLTIRQIAFSLAVLEQLGLITFGKASINDVNSFDLREADIMRATMNKFLSTTCDYFLGEMYAVILNTLSKHQVKEDDANATLPRNKHTINFLMDNVSITRLGACFIDICL